jgi:uncharacterized protein
MALRLQSGSRTTANTVFPQVGLAGSPERWHHVDHAKSTIRMAKIKFIRKYPILVFVVLTFFISHVLNPIVVELLHILLPNFSFDFPEAGLSERSLINQYGGSIAAVIITLSLYGVHGLISILRFSRIRRRTIFWLFTSLVLPLFMIILSYCLAGISLMSLLTILQKNWSFYLLIIAGFVLSAGLAEEFGWRGFLLPQLLKTQKPLTATFIIFVIVSLWHFPALLAGWKNEPLLPWILLSFSVAVIHSWLFFKSGANLWVVVLFHACFDTQYSFYSRYIPDNIVPNNPFHQGWIYTILYCLLAFVIILTTKGSLGYDSSDFNLSRYFETKKRERPTEVLRHVKPES